MKKGQYHFHSNYPQYWVFVDPAIWGHHLRLLHPERARDRRNVNNTALQSSGVGMFYVT